MPHDPELVAETRSWLVKGKMDLDAAVFELTAVPPFTADVVFHAQQAAEKAFKGFLTWHSCPFRKTHNLEEIGQSCVEIDAQYADGRLLGQAASRSPESAGQAPAEIERVRRKVGRSAPTAAFFPARPGMRQGIEA